jgi:hemerythrin-like domain-containing protein
MSNDVVDATRRSFLRRGVVLAGGIGLLVGAGATEAADLISSGSSPTVAVAPPGEDLMAEHGVLKRVLLVYQYSQQRIDAGDAPPVQAIHGGAQIIHDFIESFHEALEETYVFPRLRSAGQLTSTVDTLLVQHARGRQITQLLLAGTDPTTPNPLASTAAQDRVSAGLGAFVRMYQPHEAREDTVVFPAYRALLSPSEIDEAGATFAALQTTQFGPDGFNSFVSQVAGIEQDLGIYDLDQFTPPQTES